jgi:hypothetical protein
MVAGGEVEMKLDVPVVSGDDVTTSMHAQVEVTRKQGVLEFWYTYLHSGE